VLGVDNFLNWKIIIKYSYNIYIFTYSLYNIQCDLLILQLHYNIILLPTTDKWECCVFKDIAIDYIYYNTKGV